MKTTPTVLAAALIACGLMTGAAHAQSTPEIKISGFGTVAGTVTDDSSAGFHKSMAVGTGVNHRLDVGSDSRLGLQGVVGFQNGVSITAQAVAMRRAVAGSTSDKDLDIDIEWMYAQYQINDKLNVRLGRMQLPVYLLSDSLNVGYAAPWLRAPVAFYMSEPFSRLEGLQMNWRDTFAGFNVSGQLSYGTSAATLGGPTGGSEVKSNAAKGVSFSVERGDWLARAGIVNLNIPAGFLDDISDTYASVGMQYDNGKAVVLSEFARRSENEQPALGGQEFSKGHYFYVAAGWRFGKVLPLVQVSRVHTHAFGGVGIVEIMSRSYGASLRYDIASNVALKAQVDHYKANDGQVFVKPSTTDSHGINVFTVGADFVF